MSIGELGEILDFDLEREMILWGIWGGEVYDGICMERVRVVRNGGAVGFWGDLAIGKYSGLVSRCTKSF